MASLINQTKNKTLIEDLNVARSFKERAQGLIGTKSLTANQGLWFPSVASSPSYCWIHTYFMSIPIDVIYLDSDMKVKKLEKNLKPWKFAAPVFGSNSLVEVAAGFIEKNDVQLGDKLHVGN